MPKSGSLEKLKFFCGGSGIDSFSEISWLLNGAKGGNRGLSSVSSPSGTPAALRMRLNGTLQARGGREITSVPVFAGRNLSSSPDWPALVMERDIGGRFLKGIACIQGRPKSSC